MFSHIFIGNNDFAKSHTFYNQLMQTLGVDQRFYDETKPWAGWHSAGGARPVRYWSLASHLMDKSTMQAMVRRWRSLLQIERPLIKPMTLQLQTVGPMKANPGYAPNTMPITTVPIFATLTETNSV